MTGRALAQGLDARDLLRRYRAHGQLKLRDALFEFLRAFGDLA